MKILAIVLRILVGLPFFVFGLNYFFHLFTMAPPASMPEEAKQFGGVLESTKYMNVVKVLELTGGFLLLVGRLVPLGLVLLVPVTVNIALWDALIMKYAGGPPLGTVLLVLEVVLIWLYRPYFAPLFTVNAKPAAVAVP
jgi:putative oxidoreductase